MLPTEELIKNKYESQQYTVVNKGSPDFLIFKRENNQIKDIGFIEVKKNITNRLSREQRIWKEVINTLKKLKIID